jgi:hypothetical protein
MPDLQRDIRAYYVDIVMCIDATASMSPIINEVKANILSFYQRYIDSMEEEDKDIAQVRIKVIAFRDYGCPDAEPMEQSGFFVMPEQSDEFRAFIDSIEAKGGFGGPENALEAIAYALKSDWTTEGAKRRHIILVFSDAPALPLGARADSPFYPSDMPADLPQPGAWWEGTDQTLSSTYQPSAGRLVAFVPVVSPWTEMQAWNRYWPAFFAAGTKVEASYFQLDFHFLVGDI